MVSSMVIGCRNLAVILFIFAVVACAAQRPMTPSGGAETKGSPKSIGSSSSEPTGEVRERSGPLEEAIQKSILYLKQGRSEAAQEVLERLIVSHGEQGKLHNALGVVYKNQGKTDQAIQSYKKAIELRNGHVKAYFNLALLYREKGDFKGAEKEYRHALFLDPEFAQAHYNLGILYDLYTNQPKKALKHYKEYKGLDGNNKKVDMWIRDLSRRVEAETPAAAANKTGEAP